MTRHQLALEFRSADGHVLGQRAVPDVVLEPACQWATLALLRRGDPQPDLAAWQSEIDPVFEPAGDGPYLTGFQVALMRGGTRVRSPVFETAYFRRFARRAAADLRKQAQMTAEEPLRFRVFALPREGEDCGVQAFDVSPRALRAELPPVALDELTRQSLRFGEILPDELPVYLPQRILIEAEEMTEKAGPTETGGLLIGHLARDATAGEVAVQITAQIPVRHTEQSLNELVFTPATWAAAEAAMALRGQGEVLLGNWHSHPNKYFCRAECSPEARRACPLMHEFFSEDDVTLHETVFPRPFHVALVTSNTESGLRHSLYGWRDGLIQQRGFWILHGDRTLAPGGRVEPGMDPHETPCH